MLDCELVLPGRVCVPVMVGFLPVLTSRIPAECRSNSGEADYAKPENLDSGPQVSFNLLCVDGLGCLLVVRGLFGVLFVSALVTAAIACLRPEGLKLGSGCGVCCMDLSITPQKGIPSQSNPT